MRSTLLYKSTDVTLRFNKDQLQLQTGLMCKRLEKKTKQKTVLAASLTHTSISHTLEKNIYTVYISSSYLINKMSTFNATLYKGNVCSHL